MEILAYIVGSGGLIGLLGIFIRTGKILEKINNLDTKSDSHSNSLKELKDEMHSQGERIARIEGYLTGRDYRPENKKTGTGH